MRATNAPPLNQDYTPPPTISEGYSWDRGPAHLEAAVLGTILARPDAAAGEIIDRFSDEAFSHPHLRAIYHAIRTLRADGISPDPINVTDRMRMEGTLTDADPVYLVELAASTVTPSLLPSLVEKLRANALRQLMRDLAQTLHDAAGAPRPDFSGVAVLLRTIAGDLEETRPDQALHDLSTYTRSRYALHRRPGR